MLVDEIPNQNEAVVPSRGEDAPAVWRPFDTVQGGGVALQLEEGLSRLPHVKHTNDVGVLGECGQEVGVMRRSCGEVNCLLLVKSEDGVDMFIPAILSSGGGHKPDCDGPDGLELPGLITAIGGVSIRFHHRYHNSTPRGLTFLSLF